jgi:hypothetical protein
MISETSNHNGICLKSTPAGGNTPLRFPLSALLAVLLISIFVTACAAGSHEPAAGDVLAEATAPAPVKFGAYTFGGIWQGSGPVLQLEAELGRRLDIIHWYTNWNNEWDSRLLEPFRDSGRIPLVSWQSHDQPVHEIAAGLHDGYLRRWARDVRDYGQEVFLRPFPEMNGDWTSWNGDPAALVQAWQHVVTLFRKEGAVNARWVWSPNVTDEPRTDGNRMELYYPGAEFVDVLALDGFNWGTVRPWIGWRSFEEVFGSAYERVAALGAQPVWFAETASAEAGGSKAEWVLDMFNSQAFPRLDAIVWFNENKETDWRVSSSPRALATFQAVLPLLNNELAAARTDSSNQAD